MGYCTKTSLETEFIFGITENNTFAEGFFCLPAGFQYNEWCPRDFKDDMYDCYTEYLQPHQLSFFEDNDLVVNKGRREIRQACG